MPQDELTIDPSVMSEILVHRDRYFTVPETRLDHVLAAVEGLDEPQRSVTELVIWGKHSKAETARILGFSRQYVHKLWADARDVLKESLGEMLQED